MKTPKKYLAGAVLALAPIFAAAATATVSMMSQLTFNTNKPATLVTDANRPPVPVSMADWDGGAVTPTGDCAQVGISNVTSNTSCNFGTLTNWNKTMGNGQISYAQAVILPATSVLPFAAASSLSTTGISSAASVGMGLSTSGSNLVNYGPWVGINFAQGTSLTLSAVISDASNCSAASINNFLCEAYGDIKATFIEKATGKRTEVEFVKDLTSGIYGGLNGNLQAGVSSVTLNLNGLYAISLYNNVITAVDGLAIANAALPVPGQPTINIPAVPEPGTNGLMVLGTGLVGLMAARRRREDVLALAA